tara:strand:+ start:105 stop:257 length:153 start_codon:yes stop_codon:yes gene_type:complete
VLAPLFPQLLAAIEGAMGCEFLGGVDGVPWGQLWIDWFFGYPVCIRAKLI